MYLDEFGNSSIPHFPEYISLVRSAGIALVVVVQGFGQIEQQYGPQGRETILANTSTHIVFAGCGMAETAFYSERLGEQTIPIYTAAQTGIISETYTRSHAQRRLMYPDEIRRLPVGSLLIVAENIAPLLAWNLPYFMQPNLMQKIGLPYQLPHHSQVPLPRVLPRGVPPSTQSSTQHFQP